MEDCNLKSSEQPTPTVIVDRTSVVHLGLDLGTHTTILAASADGAPFELRKDMLTTVVGFPKRGILPGILPDDVDVMIGDEAIDHRLHLDLRWPLSEGIVDDLATCCVFVNKLRGFVDTDDNDEIWGVVGTPAKVSEEREKDIRTAMSGFLNRMLTVPEPFLAAMGLREDEAFKMYGSSADPTKHSLVVDIGAGTTDLCLVQGYFPEPRDQVSLNKAGDFVDRIIGDSIRSRYPDVRLSRVAVQKIKEKFSFVTGCERRAIVKIRVDGRLRALDLSEIIREACDQLVPPVIDGIKRLLRRCDPDAAQAVLENIIVTGGGSQIQGLCETIEKRLHREEYDCARCIKPMNYRRLVARGALRVAEDVREDQWQLPM